MLPGFVLGMYALLSGLVALSARRPKRREASDPQGIVRSLAIAFPALLLPFVIRAAVVEGIATATEVSTIGIVYAVIVGILFYRQFPLEPLSIRCW